MADYDEHEKYHGEWNGEPVSFNRYFRGVRLSDEQCRELCAGNSVEIRGLTSRKSGTNYGIIGKLAILEGKSGDFEYVGIEQLDFLHDVKRGIPNSLCGHEFSENDKRRLLGGHTIHVNDFISTKNGEQFECDVQYDEENDQVIFIREHRGVPKELCHHKFTDDERLMLESGMTVDVDDFISQKTGKPFACRVTYDSEADKINFDFDRE